MWKAKVFSVFGWNNVKLRKILNLMFNFYRTLYFTTRHRLIPGSLVAADSQGSVKRNCWQLVTWQPWATTEHVQRCTNYKIQIAGPKATPKLWSAKNDKFSTLRCTTGVGCCLRHCEQSQGFCGGSASSATRLSQGITKPQPGIQLQTTVWVFQRTAGDRLNRTTTKARRLGKWWIQFTRQVWIMATNI